MFYVGSNIDRLLDLLASAEVKIQNYRDIQPTHYAYSDCLKVQ